MNSKASSATSANGDAQEALRKMMEDGPDASWTPADLEKFARGELTWSELTGMSMDEAYAFAEIGWTLLQQGKLQEAQAVIAGLVLSNPYDSNLHALLGSVHGQRGSTDEALREYGIAIDLDPKNLAARVNRAELLLRTGRIPEAVEDLKQAVALDPKGEKPAGVRARALAGATSRIVAEAAKQLKVAKR